MRVILRYVLAVLFVQFACCGVLPVDKCKLEDSACMISAFQKALPTYAAGLPELGVDALDVMHMDDIAFDLLGLQFSIKDPTMKGLKSSVIKNVKWDTNKKTFEVTFTADTTIKGKYTAAGRVLILPITGDGQLKIKLKNVEIKFTVHYDLENDHVVPKKFTYVYDVKDSAHYTLTNLFNGNKELSDAMLKFLNENWKQITVEFGTPIMDVGAKHIFKTFKSFFAKQALSDIADV